MYTLPQPVSTRFPCIFISTATLARDVMTISVKLDQQTRVDIMYGVRCACVCVRPCSHLGILSHVFLLMSN